MIGNARSSSNVYLQCLMPQPRDTAPGQRYRLEQWQPLLRDYGIDLDLSYLLDDMSVMRGLWKMPPTPSAVAQLARASATRLRRVMTGPPPDAYVLYREASLLGPPLIEAMMKRRAPVIFDLDDAIWLLPDGYNSWALKNIVRMPSKTRSIMRWSAGVSAGNAYLAEFSRTLCPTVEVVPSTIDTTNAYARQKQHVDHERMVVGWSGSHSTARYLESILPALAEVARDLPLRLLVVGARVSHPALDIECREWRAATEVDDLLEMDVGLMPLNDDAWSRGKCGMKALQYMGVGIPAIVSPVGVNRVIVTPGVNGYYAERAEDWRNAIVAMKNASDRNRLGAAAKETVRTRYSTEVGAERFAALVQRVLAR